MTTASLIYSARSVQKIGHHFQVRLTFIPCTGRVNSSFIGRTGASSSQTSSCDPLDALLKMLTRSHEVLMEPLDDPALTCLRLRSHSPLSMRSVCFSFHSLRLRPSAVILSSDLSPPEIAVSSHNRLPGRPSPSPDPPQQTDTSNSKDPNVTNIADHNATLPSPVEQENTICTKRTLLPLTQNAWELAVERCIDKLKPEDKITVLQWKRDQILSAEDVDEIVRPLKERYASSRSFRCISSSYPFLEHLRSFSTVIDVCVQTNPNPGALIWGCVKLVLEVRYCMLLEY